MRATRGCTWLHQKPTGTSPASSTAAARGTSHGGDDIRREGEGKRYGEVRAVTLDVCMSSEEDEVDRSDGELPRRSFTGHEEEDGWRGGFRASLSDSLRVEVEDDEAKLLPQTAVLNGV